jgi:hypothetical protein
MIELSGMFDRKMKQQLATNQRKARDYVRRIEAARLDQTGGDGDPQRRIL